MTVPKNDDAHSLAATETANPVKQQTGQETQGGSVGEKEIPPANRIQVGDETEQFSEKSRRAEMYLERLERFWAAAHRDGSGVENSRERRIFLKTMIEVSEDLSILITDEELASLSIDVIKGNPREVELQVAEHMAANPDPRDLARFIRLSIASAIDRLEISREGTPEMRVDIVARALFELRGSMAAAKLGCELYRHLQYQKDRSEGYCQTVGNLALIVSAEGSAYMTEAMFLYHSILAGVRDLYGVPDSASGVSGSEVSRNLVSTAAARLARILVKRVGEMGPDVRARALPVLHDLMTLSAVTCPVPSFEVSVPEAVAAALRLQIVQPAESLAVLIDMAEVADAWEFSSITTSQLEASGAVASAASGNMLRAVDLFYNSGISLRARKEADSAHSEDVLSRARMLLNVIGLRLVLTFEKDPYKALVDLDGIDCAVNFVGVFVEYRSNGDVGLIASLQPLAVEIAHLSKWPLLKEAKRRTDISRLERSATLLGLTVEVRSTFPELERLVLGAVAALRGSFGFKSRELDDIIADTADLVGSLYDSALIGEGSGQLQSLVVKMASAHGVAMQVLNETYEKYAPTMADSAGIGPAVAAGVITEAEWRGVAERLTDPVTSIVGAIAEFSG